MKHACRMGLKRNDGQHNAAAKLGRAEVIAIGMNYLVGDSIAELARQFGVSYDTVRLIVKDKTWKGV
jgi:transposase